MYKSIEIAVVATISSLLSMQAEATQMDSPEIVSYNFAENEIALEKIEEMELEEEENLSD